MVTAPGKVIVKLGPMSVAAVVRSRRSMASRNARTIALGEGAESDTAGIGGGGRRPSRTLLASFRWLTQGQVGV